MYLQQLKNIMIIKGLRQSDIAQKGGVSRAAVTRWFQSQKGWANVESKTLLNLAKALGVSPSIFFEERETLAPLEFRFLWDHLYPNMESFVQALVQKRLPALARLVQVLGFHSSQAVIGKKVVPLFEKYKKYIKPVRRKELEVLWPLYASRK